MRAATDSWFCGTGDDGETTAMCDLAYINLLREKVRQLQSADRRAAIFGVAPRGRFVPISLAPAQQPEERTANATPAE
jgi:hypothetical protein